ncbi:hypothetical protein Hypma_008810 [Hypsizygus marmoreus]|uniref:NYN domain-containing protein n=1 Tax=Hypsizygus marmoreus TaxID=39966 RepID=A0A369JUK4_HYPMA|nr:hypothetical protein Hypma_008810 [Hypsizygus marmoreus]
MIPEDSVAIFWDYENCHASSALTGYEVVKKIRSVAHTFGTVKLFKAYLELTDPATFSKTLGLRSELQSSGVSLIDCPHNGRKDVADKMMLVDMLAYAIDTPAPSTILLISGDRDFAYAVAILRLRRYRIVIISLPTVHTSLKAQASIFLDWSADVLGGVIIEELLPSTQSTEYQREERYASSSTHYPPALTENGNMWGTSSVANRPEPPDTAHATCHPMNNLSHNTREVVKPDTLSLSPGPRETEAGSKDVAPDFYSETIKPETSIEDYPVSGFRLPASANNQDASLHSINTPRPVYEEADRSTVLQCNSIPPNSTASAQSSGDCEVPTFASRRSSQPIGMDAGPFCPRYSSSPAGTSGSQLPVPPNPLPPMSPSDSRHTAPVPYPSPSPTPTQRPASLLVPPAFVLLVRRLECHRLKGVPRPLRSKLGAELVTQDGQLYSRAGVKGFGQYVAIAEREGIVELGGQDGGTEGPDAVLSRVSPMGSHDEDVAIFWDYENCHAAAHLTGYEIVKRICSMAHNFGTIKLFKAYVQLSDPVTFSKSLALRSELQASGVSLTDCPHNGRKDVADKMMLVDMLAHAIDHPAPSTIILISGDRDFAYAVSILRLRRYRVVVVSLPGVHASLKAQASSFLDWNAEVLGVDMTDHSQPPSAARYDERRRMTMSSRQSQVHPEKPNITPTPLSTRYDAEEIEIDIMDHLPHRSSIRRPRVQGESQEVSQPEIDPSSYRARATPRLEKEHEPSPPFLRPPSRTESAPATLYMEEISPAPTVVSQPPSYLHASNASPAASQHSSDAKPHMLTPMLDPNGRPQGLSMLPNTPPPSQYTKAHAPQVLAKSALLANDPLVMTPSLTSSTLPTPGSSAVPAPLVPKVVPPIFRLLVQRLEYHRSKGYPRPFRSGVAVELATQDNNLYRSAGAERFGQYVAMAEKAGIVELGGREGGAWISLRSEWYNAKLS